MEFNQVEKICATSPSASVEYITPEYPIIKVSNAFAKATICCHGAHLTEYTPLNSKSLIFLSEKAEFRVGKAVRGGIPICWPWFNAHPNNLDLPSHGFVRNNFWELVEIKEDDQTTDLKFNFPFTDQHFEMIGGKVNLQLLISIGKKLTIELSTTNLDDKEIPIGGAIHTYLAVNDIAQCTVKGLKYAHFFDSLTRKEGISENELLKFSQEYDRVFIQTDSSTVLQDASINRTIQIDKVNSQATCVWNPWIKKASSIEDLDDLEYKKFLCIEALNWREDLKLLAKGETHTLGQIISLEESADNEQST